MHTLRLYEWTVVIEINYFLYSFKSYSLKSLHTLISSVRHNFAANSKSAAIENSFKTYSVMFLTCSIAGEVPESIVLLIKNHSINYLMPVWIIF